MKAFLASLKTKTSMTALLGLIGAGYAYWIGEMSGPQVMEAVWAAVMVIFLRHGVAKSGPGNNGG